MAFFWNEGLKTKFEPLLLELRFDYVNFCFEMKVEFISF
jgi:hypothetical protein